MTTNHYEIEDGADFSYDLCWRGDENHDASGAPPTGTLEEVIAYAQSAGLEATLLDAAGFTRGWVHANGTWSLR